MNLSEAYLSHVHIYVQSGDSEIRNLRTFLDNWFQYEKGPPFLNSNGRPIWFNKPDPVKYREALLAMHFVSSGARQVLDGVSDEDLVKDHAVPVKVISQQLSLLDNPTLEDMATILRSLYSLGVITKNEDNLLNSAGLRQKMPDGWKLGDDIFARYRASRIFGSS